MSGQSRLSSLITAIGADIKSIKSGAALAGWPVGSIFMSVSPTNPNTTLGGGTWVAWGTGRVPVAIDTAQTEFDTVEEVGGEKTHKLTAAEMSSHTHVQNSHTHADTFAVAAAGLHKHVIDYEVRLVGSGTINGVIPATGGSSSSANPVEADGSHAHTVSGSVSTTTATNQFTGGDVPHNNLQPYITCYMWKRTA